MSITSAKLAQVKQQAEDTGSKQYQEQVEQDAASAALEAKESRLRVNYDDLNNFAYE